MKLEKTICDRCDQALEVVKNKEQLIKFLEKVADENGREEYD